MNPETAFDIHTQEYSIHRLQPEDIEAVQALFEKCLDFMLLVDGRAAGPQAAREEFQSVPPGWSLADKFLFGIVDQQKDLVGYLDVMRGYPQEGAWWIGLLLLVPQVRSQGLGQKVTQGFTDYIRTNHGREIMLGVVENNQSAYKFWTRMGFELVRVTEPQQFGNKTQTVSILRRSI